ncbi:hypothetical protein PNOK_0790300 [Pyrrhoderma noxium]|uniref:Uncharacterized protein n=1 Tax=Pyrrhoderma noxium TaxID=2282107 RepID=A0A286U9P1_9AGAM|nr:hypothetical protein PNOK_0790300 [Pyrrhoderma noxium]
MISGRQFLYSVASTTGNKKVRPLPIPPQAIPSPNIGPASSNPKPNRDHNGYVRDTTRSRPFGPRQPSSPVSLARKPAIRKKSNAVSARKQCDYHSYSGNGKWTSFERNEAFNGGHWVESTRIRTTFDQRRIH